MSIRCSAQYLAQPEHKQLFGLLLFAWKHTQANLESPHPPRDSVLRTPSLSPLLGSQAGQQSPQGQLRSPRLPWTLSSDGPSGQGPSSLSNAEGAARPEEQEAAPGRVARMLRNQDSSAATRPSLGSRSRPLPRLCKSHPFQPSIGEYTSAPKLQGRCLSIHSSAHSGPRRHDRPHWDTRGRSRRPRTLALPKARPRAPSFCEGLHLAVSTQEHTRVRGDAGAGGREGTSGPRRHWRCPGGSPPGRPSRGGRGPGGRPTPEQRGGQSL